MNKIRRFFYSVARGFKIGYWAFKNPLVLQTGNFQMLTDLMTMILTVANEDRHMMSHIGFIHPDEGEQQIVSIWAGAGLGAEPTKRIAELLAENARLKSELSKHIDNQAKK